MFLKLSVFFCCSPHFLLYSTTDYLDITSSILFARYIRRSWEYSRARGAKNLIKNFLSRKRISLRETILYANRVTSVYIVITFRYRYINGISNDRLVVIEIGQFGKKSARSLAFDRPPLLQMQGGKRIERRRRVFFFQMAQSKMLKDATTQGKRDREGNKGKIPTREIHLG